MKSLIKQIPFHTGNSIPQIGFGTYELRGPSCQQSVSQAIQAGYRLIDTGTLYRNEQDLKTVLEGLYSSQKLTRSDMFLTSKIGPSEQGYENTLKTCEGILKKLGTNYLDLLIINWPGVHGTKPEDPMNAEVRLHTWRALERLKGDGKVRDIGVSNFLKRHLLDLFKNSTSKPVINQIEAHPLGYDEETIELCRVSYFKGVFIII